VRFRAARRRTGAILATGWEIAERFSFIPGGRELAGAYTLAPCWLGWSRSP